MRPRIYFQDLRDLSRDLRTLDDAAFERGLRPVLKDFADRTAGEVRSEYQSLYPTDQEGAASVRGLASLDRAAVAVGSARAPWFLGNDFGSKQGPRKKQFPEFVAGGRVLYPKLMDRLPEFEADLLEELDRFLAPVFVDGTLTRGRLTLDVAP